MEGKLGNYSFFFWLECHRETRNKTVVVALSNGWWVDDCGRVRPTVKPSCWHMTTTMLPSGQERGKVFKGESSPLCQVVLFVRCCSLLILHLKIELPVNCAWISGLSRCEFAEEGGEDSAAQNYSGKNAKFTGWWMRERKERAKWSGASPS